MRIIRHKFQYDALLCQNKLDKITTHDGWEIRTDSAELINEIEKLKQNNTRVDWVRCKPNGKTVIVDSNGNEYAVVASGYYWLEVKAIVNEPEMALCLA